MSKSRSAAIMSKSHRISVSGMFIHASAVCVGMERERGKGKGERREDTRT